MVLSFSERGRRNLRTPFQAVHRFSPTCNCNVVDMFLCMIFYIKTVKVSLGAARRPPLAARELVGTRRNHVLTNH